MNDNCCFPPQDSNSWIDWQHATPIEILDLIASSTLGGTIGSFANSSDYGTPGTWAATPVTITSNPTCATLGTDNLQKVADAAQWNFSNQTANVATTNALPLRKVVFLRAGTDWEMNIPLDFGLSTYTEVQLSFLNNAGTRGDSRGTIPVIQWTGTFTGAVTFKVTLKMPGSYTMGLRAKTGTTVSMFEMNWKVVADQPKLPISLDDLKVQSFITGMNRGGGLMEQANSLQCPTHYKPGCHPNDSFPVTACCTIGEYTLMNCTNRCSKADICTPDHW